ncbi:Dam family site-specific DNA-(adenine-N6)-methyltransferase [Pseudomonas viridiflava]|uniref:DNA adenine methylase n=1 Tax=Pseudomonas viridiflava TaxID=33069 RepID=UPI002A6B5B4A|nr:Dam family site-specific DNA-(adenine-N6)-methyltransferase [Pseudomonas viridiflava]MDY0915223.1 Dam family site-specific DNA-(adenine-N6)-methyltransferase [Pseudomonas viridiflava]
MISSSDVSVARITTGGTSPLIRWPGGKRALVAQLTNCFPNSFRKYYEPFFGGGALFFALTPDKAILSDINPDLICAYTVVRDNPIALIDELRGYENTEDFYYKIRASRPKLDVEKAARLLFLTRHSFNGIYRVNLNGDFNVPYGKKYHVTAFDSEKILEVHSLLDSVVLLVSDFEAATACAEEGDIIYFDPPYTVAHANNGFVKYNENIFSWADQVRLAEHARVLASKGCFVAISNADHESVDKLYQGFNKIVISRFSVIAASSAHRRKITECLYFLGGNSLDR